MRSVLNWLQTGSLAAAVWVGAMASDAMAGVIINITPSGSDVVATLSGSLSSLGASNGNNDGGGGQVGGSVISVQHITIPFSLDNDGFTILDPGNYLGLGYDLTFTSGAWGSGYFNTSADSYTLSGIGYFSLKTQNGGRFNLSDSYVFGTPITGTATWNNKTLADLGITNLGTYVYTVGSGANTDTVTFVMSSGSAVPEPTSMAIFGLGALGFAYRNRRKLLK